MRNKGTRGAETDETAGETTGKQHDLSVKGGKRRAVTAPSANESSRNEEEEDGDRDDEEDDDGEESEGGAGDGDIEERGEVEEVDPVVKAAREKAEVERLKLMKKMKVRNVI